MKRHLAGFIRRRRIKPDHSIILWAAIFNRWRPIPEDIGNYIDGISNIGTTIAIGIHYANGNGTRPPKGAVYHIYRITHIYQFVVIGIAAWIRFAEIAKSVAVRVGLRGVVYYRAVIYRAGGGRITGIAIAVVVGICTLIAGVTDPVTVKVCLIRIG
jgi:hypothetical protein